MLWIRVLACVLAFIMLFSLFALNAVRIKLGHDAKTEAEKTGASALAENSEYLDASTPERLSQWLSTVLSSPETYEDYYQIASILIAQGEYARALPNIDASIRLYGGSEQPVIDELYMKQGSLHAMLGEYDAMELSFTHVSEDSSYHAQKLLLIAQAAIERGDAKKGVEYLTQYLSANPEDIDMHLALGQLYILETDYENAAKTFGHAIDQSADEGGSLHFLRGSCYMEQREFTLALNDFNDARTLGYPDAALCDAQCSLCSFLCAKYEDCIAYGEKALAGASEMVSKPDLYYYIGVAEMTLGNYEAALDSFTNSVALDAMRQDADYYATVCLLALDRQDEAIDRFTALIESGYSLSLCYYNRAACYLAKRQYALAKADLEKVVEINEDEELIAAAKALLQKL